MKNDRRCRVCAGPMGQGYFYCSHECAKRARQASEFARAGNAWSQPRLGTTTVLGRRGSSEERFMVKVQVQPDGCWLWLGSRNHKGYGLFTDEVGKNCRAHRWGYEHFAGQIPDGMVLDHLCRNTSCVNPAHLEPVTAAENTRRGRLARA